MKNLWLLFVLLFVSALAYADRINLDSDETLSTPVSEALDWEIIKINAKEKILQVKYRWKDSDDAPIFLGSSRTWMVWTCQNVSEGNNDDCIDVDDPWDCCTGAGTGTCPEVTDTCFSDVFGFLVRSQDVDTKIGVGLRTLIWNKMRPDILTGDNDGTFENN